MFYRLQSDTYQIYTRLNPLLLFEKHFKVYMFKKKRKIVGKNGIPKVSPAKPSNMYCI